MLSCLILRLPCPKSNFSKFPCLLSQSISCSVSCTWSAFANFPVLPNLMVSQCSFFLTPSALSVSPIYSSLHVAFHYVDNVPASLRQFTFHTVESSQCSFSVEHTPQSCLPCYPSYFFTQTLHIWCAKCSPLLFIFLQPVLTLMHGTYFLSFHSFLYKLSCVAVLPESWCYFCCLLSVSHLVTWYNHRSVHWALDDTSFHIVCVIWAELEISVGVHFVPVHFTSQLPIFLPFKFHIHER